MIDNRNLRQYKTAGNWAVFTYMSDSIPENDFKPYQYDFENFMSNSNIESSLVSRLLKRKRGNCRSLPFLYKILLFLEVVSKVSLQVLYTNETLVIKHHFPFFSPH